MRFRNKPWAKEKIAEHPQFVVPNPEEIKGNWGEFFPQDQPLYIEVGTGKGQFVTEMARSHPEQNFIGIELHESVILAALDRLIDADLPNLKLLHINASDLAFYFNEHEVSRVYLNFSDPWPKARHEKRRLTYKNFLQLYEFVLIPGGELHFKTDNQSLFEYSLTSFSHYGMALNSVSLDLHKSDFEGNIMTEYEEKFSQIGNRIYRCEAQFRVKK